MAILLGEKITKLDRQNDAHAEETKVDPVRIQSILDKMESCSKINKTCFSQNHQCPMQRLKVFRKVSGENLKNRFS